MYSFDLKSKLKRLNPNLFIDDSAKSHVYGDFYVSALNLNRFKRSDAATTSEYNSLTKEAREWLQDYDKGLLPEHVCSVPTGWIPEYDIFAFDKEKKTSRYVARGWRTVLIILAQKGIVTLDKARRVFDRPGLGVDTYDRLTRDEKEAWAAGVKESA